jgi:minor histocompatibility antigen H13
MIAIALRFDLYLHYLRKQKQSSTSNQITKAKYEEAAGQWGERFWTSRSKEITAADGARFPKVYFTASLMGYVVGMVTTISVMRVWNHAQPALLYLVPGVLITVWGTALLRGDWRLMWEYTEDGSLHVDGGEKDESNGSVPRSESSNKGSEESDRAKEKKKKEKEEHAHHVFLFSLSEPRHMKKAKLFESGE